jgi:hypothetical protein
MDRLTWLLLVACCAPTLYLRFLPMVDLPQYVAAARMLTHLNDPALELAPYYTLAIAKAPAVVTLYLLGWLADLSSLDVATRLVVFLSVVSYPLGLCALLRAQGKPLAFALLGFPVIYASPFYWGLLPSSLSVGLALCAVALVVSGRRDLRARLALLALCALLPLTHPLGVLVAASYVALAALTRGRDDNELPWPWLAPLLLGAAYWCIRALRADGVAGYNDPSVAYRALQLPALVIGGFGMRNELLLLGAEVVLCIFLWRGAFPWTPEKFRRLPHGERALYLGFALCVLGYFALPANSEHSVVMLQRAGVLAFALLPALLPARRLEPLPLRVSLLLLALGVSATWHTTSNLRRFDAEARPFASVLDHVRWRPKLVGLIYDKTGHVASGVPYIHFAAYAQARVGGLLALSVADFAWTLPLRRKPDAPAPLPPYGADWEPAILHVQPERFLFYDTVIVRGKEPREMTLFMESPFRLVHRSGEWLVYMR